MNAFAPIGTITSNVSCAYVSINFFFFCTCADSRPSCCAAGWRVCGVGSRFTSSAESRYSPTEGEALGVVNALEKTRYFTLGCSRLIVGTDHKPLLGLFKTRSLDGIDTPRLRRLKERTFGWQFDIIHVPGRSHGGPDALSRYGVRDSEQGPPPSDDHHLTALLASPLGPEDGIDEDFLLAVSPSMQPIDWSTVAQASRDDAAIRTVIHLLHSTSPPPTALDPATQELWCLRRDLSSNGPVLLYRGRAVIPQALRHRVLTALHSAHQGVTGMRLRAERAFFWPAMAQDIEVTRRHCSTCNRHAPSQSDLPPVPPVTPEYPFQHVAADFFAYMGHNYGVVVDRFSNWFQV